MSAQRNLLHYLVLFAAIGLMTQQNLQADTGWNQLHTFTMRSGYKNSPMRVGDGEIIYLERGQRDYLLTLEKDGSSPTTLKKLAQLFAEPRLWYDKGFMSYFDEDEIFLIEEAFKLFFNEQRQLVKTYFRTAEFRRSLETASAFNAESDQAPRPLPPPVEKPSLLRSVVKFCSRHLR